MRDVLRACFLMIVLIFVSTVSADRATMDRQPEPSTGKSIRDVGVPFIVNRGQQDSRIGFCAPMRMGTVFVTTEGQIVYSLGIPAARPDREEGGFECESSRLVEAFVGGSPSSIAGQGWSRNKVNWFLGDSPDGWVRDVSACESVEMSSLYEGIDLKLRAYGNNVEKLFFVNPGADPERIRVRVSGAHALRSREDGLLEAETDVGTIRFTRPVAYQHLDGLETEVEVEYAVDGNEYGFLLGEYEEDEMLVIDPLLASTFLGGSATDDDYEPAMAVGPDGHVYVCSYTYSTDFPTTAGVYDESHNSGIDCFIAKFGEDLTTLLASTFIGGSRSEYGSSLLVTTNGDVVVAGYTRSSNFPTTPGCYDLSHNGGRDAFVCRLDGDLTTLTASTFLGGNQDEGSQWPRTGLAEDGEGRVYVTGLTRSSNFPTTQGAFDETFNGGLGGGDVFIARFDAGLTDLNASTYLGGNNTEWRPSIALDGQGSLFLVGETGSVNFPATFGAFDNTLTGNSDIFLAKLTSDLSDLEAATFIGGTAGEEALAIQLGAEGSVYLSGYTFSPNFPTTDGAYDPSFNSEIRDVFVLMMEPDLSDLTASTFVGGSGSDVGRGMVLDSDGDVFITGNTLSADFPVTAGAFDESYDGGAPHGDALVSKLSGDLSALLASTYFGGTADDVAERLAVGRNGIIYVCGSTNSADLPTTEAAYDRSFNGGGDDCFIAAFDGDLSSGISSIGDSRIPADGFSLAGNYPNPFNPETTVEYHLPVPSLVVLKIFDAFGREVKTLVDGVERAGVQETVWNGTDRDGNDVGSGVYVCRIQTEAYSQSLKMMLIR